MIIIANFLAGIGNVLDMVLSVLMMLMIARVIISWVSADPYNPIVRFIVSSTEPFISIARRFLPRIPGPIDWSVLVVFILIVFLKTFLISSMLDYAAIIRRNAVVGGF